jgi:hypothetical protein
VVTIVPGRWQATASDIEAAFRGVASAERRAVRPFRHPWAWPQGFGSRSVEFLGLQQGETDLYLSDVAERLLWRRVPDWSFDPLLNDKLLFHEVCGGALGSVVPELYGLILQGRYHHRQGPGDYRYHPSGLARLLDASGTFVLKPRLGGHGAGIAVVRLDGELTVNEQPVEAEQFTRWAAGLDSYIVTETVVQAAYARRIFPGSVNTLRLTIANDTEEPLFIDSHQRFGTSAGAPADNFGLGGIAAPVDPVTGRFGLATQSGPDGRVQYHEHHPETGTRVTGTTIDGWPAVEALGRRLAHTFPFFRLVGWDVAVTERGPVLLEGNHMMALVTLQMHGPHLADDRVVELCRRHGVPTRDPWRQLLGARPSAPASLVPPPSLSTRP